MSDNPYKDALDRIETQVDRIRWACDPETEKAELKRLLDMFYPESGDFNWSVLD